MTKQEALMEILKGENVFCKDTNQVLGYSDFGGGFYALNGASDGGDCYVEVHTLPSDGTYIKVSCY